MSQHEVSKLDAALMKLEKSLELAEKPANTSDLCSDSESEEGPPI